MGYEAIHRAIILIDNMGTWLAEHNHKWTKEQRKEYEKTILELNKLQKLIGGGHV